MSAVLTHSYVEYAMSLKLLVGAEVDKIVSIMMVTAVLAVVLVRARRLLVRSVAKAATSTIPIVSISALTRSSLGSLPALVTLAET
jgi:hypothetical protein